MQRARSSVVPAALAAVLCCAAPAHAASLRGVTFPDTTTVGGKTVQLNGIGVRTAYIFIKVYVAGLYLEKRTTDAQTAIQTDEPKRMILQFLREVSYDEMVSAMRDGFAHTASKALQPQVDEFSGFFTEPLTEGSQATFDYVPGTGTTVTIAGHVKGTIPGVDFMRALWGIWLGDPPADSTLKAQLLGVES
jgi:hypothetical protein